MIPSLAWRLPDPGAVPLPRVGMRDGTGHGPFWLPLRKGCNAPARNPPWEDGGKPYYIHTTYIRSTTIPRGLPASPVLCPRPAGVHSILANGRIYPCPATWFLVKGTPSRAAHCQPKTRFCNGVRKSFFTRFHMVNCGGAKNGWPDARGGSPLLHQTGGGTPPSRWRKTQVVRRELSPQTGGEAAAFLPPSRPGLNSEQCYASNDGFPNINAWAKITCLTT
ncbi:hypothetical protein BDY21DRAFT_359322 [Lineolata rhizophorae]|uniref:Uncharacterized protein n=1 Tax=Lineolata rhizophorae TaxID=578093 RepID=A0A6A6NMB2_9PEZI|nr:hypothetical protein BDY21DRAFT_359322 [Lineolata rhizophorae]